MDRHRWQILLSPFMVLATDRLREKKKRKEKKRKETTTTALTSLAAGVTLRRLTFCTSSRSASEPSARPHPFDPAKDTGL